MGERVFYPAIAGKKAQVMGDPDQPHTFSYIPDIAAGLATLGGDHRADGKAWHLANAPTITPRQFITKVYEAAGTDGGVSAMPRFMVNVVALFNPDVREIKEVLFEFEGTWYRNAFSDSIATTQSVPAILTGKLGEKGLSPSSVDHPENLFCSPRRLV